MKKDIPETLFIEYLKKLNDDGQLLSFLLSFKDNSLSISPETILDILKAHFPKLLPQYKKAKLLK